ncbi:MAG: hypothetical protein ACLTK0_07340 [Anaerovoracaceae bacterium]
MYEAYKKLINTLAVNYNYNTKTDVVSANTQIRLFPGSSPFEAIYLSKYITTSSHRSAKIFRRSTNTWNSQKALGVEKLQMYDVYVPLVKLLKKISFDRPSK